MRICIERSRPPTRNHDQRVARGSRVPLGSPVSLSVRPGHQSRSTAARLPSPHRLRPSRHGVALLRPSRVRPEQRQFLSSQDHLGEDSTSGDQVWVWVWVWVAVWVAVWFGVSFGVSGWVEARSPIDVASGLMGFTILRWPALRHREAPKRPGRLHRAWERSQPASSGELARAGRGSGDGPGRAANRRRCAGA